MLLNNIHICEFIKTLFEKVVAKSNGMSCDKNSKYTIY